MHTISHGNGRFTIVIFSCSFFWDPPLKNWPCKTNLGQRIWFSNLDPSLYFSLLLLYQFLGVFTFQDGARSAQLKWAMSGTRHILAFRMSGRLALLSTDSHCAKFSVCFTLVYKLTMFLVSADSDTTNPKSTSTRPLPRRCDVPPSQCSGRNDASPVQCWHPSHAAMTQLTLPRSADTPFMQQWHCSSATLMPLSRCNDAATVQCWRVSHAAMTQLPRSADMPLTPQQCSSRAALTFLSRCNDAHVPLTLTRLSRSSEAAPTALTPLSCSCDATPAQHWHSSHAALTPLIPLPCSDDTSS